MTMSAATQGYPRATLTFPSQTEAAPGSKRASAPNFPGSFRSLGPALPHAGRGGRTRRRLAASIALQHVVAMASGPMARARLPQRRHLCGTDRRGIGTTRAKHAARGRRNWARHVTLQDDALAPPHRIGHGGDQSFRVGVLWRGDHLVAGSD